MHRYDLFPLIAHAYIWYKVCKKLEETCTLITARKKYNVKIGLKVIKCEYMNWNPLAKNRD
jgi:hypothetical protein